MATSPVFLLLTLNIFSRLIKYFCCCFVHVSTRSARHYVPTVNMTVDSLLLLNLSSVTGSSSENQEMQILKSLHESMTIQSNLQHERHEYDSNDTSATQVRHKCYTNDTNAARVKNFDFDNGTSKNMFSHSYTYYMASERLQDEEQFHSKN